MATKGEALQNIIRNSMALRKSGQTEQADFLDQKIKQIQADPRHKDLNQELGQALQQPMAQSESRMAPQQATGVPQTFQPQATQIQEPQQTQDPNDINSLVQRAIGAGRQLNPNPIEAVGGLLSTLGGGKPYVSPAKELGMEAAKANVQMTPWKQMLMQSQIVKNQAGVGTSQANTDLANERAKSVRYGNQFLEDSQGGTDANGNPLDMQVSSVSTGRGGVTLKNMNEIGNEAMAKGGAKNFTIQDAKVNQAIHLKGLLEQYHDPSTGNYNIPSAQYQELVMGLASLVANSNNTAEADRRALSQMTAQGNINGLITYLTGLPQNANSQAIIKNLADSIDRQGSIAEQERQGYRQNPTQGNSLSTFQFQGQGGTKQLDENIAKQFLSQAGGDKEKARQLAKSQGYSF